MVKSEIQTLLEEIESWPAEKQLLVYQVCQWLQDEDGGGRELTPEEDAELNEALAEADRKEFLTDEEMKVFFDKFR